MMISEQSDYLFIQNPGGANLPPVSSGDTDATSTANGL